MSTLTKKIIEGKPPKLMVRNTSPIISSQRLPGMSKAKLSSRLSIDVLNIDFAT